MYFDSYIYISYRFGMTFLTVSSLVLLCDGAERSPDLSAVSGDEGLREQNVLVRLVNPTLDNSTHPRCNGL